VNKSKRISSFIATRNIRFSKIFNADIKLAYRQAGLRLHQTCNYSVYWSQFGVKTMHLALASKKLEQKDKHQN